MYLIYKLMKQIYSIVILSAMITSRTQESCIYLFPIDIWAILDISPKHFVFLKTFNIEFSNVEV